MTRLCITTSSNCRHSTKARTPSCFSFFLATWLCCSWYWVLFPIMKSLLSMSSQWSQPELQRISLYQFSNAKTKFRIDFLRLLNMQSHRTSLITLSSCVFSLMSPRCWWQPPLVELWDKLECIDESVRARLSCAAVLTAPDHSVSLARGLSRYYGKSKCQLTCCW